MQFIDDKGARDVTEFLNIAKDDALAWPTSVHRTYPSTVNARMESTIKPFVQKSLSINHFLIDILNDRLGLPEGTLAAFHKAGEHSGCTARVIRAPPLVDFDKVFLTAHTDYGSLVSNQPHWNFRLAQSSTVVSPQPSWGPASPASWLRQMVLCQSTYLCCIERLSVLNL